APALMLILPRIKFTRTVPGRAGSLKGTVTGLLAEVCAPAIPPIVSSVHAATPTVSFAITTVSPRLALFLPDLPDLPDRPDPPDVSSILPNLNLPVHRFKLQFRSAASDSDRRKLVRPVDKPAIAALGCHAGGHRRRLEIGVDAAVQGPQLQID